MSAKPAPNTTVLLSGGLDSATALLLARARGSRAEALFVDYHQEAASEELTASERIADELGVPHTVVSLAGVEVCGGEIVGRNAMLVSVALMTAKPPSTIVLGVHRGTEYWDCSREFLARMQAVLNGYGAGAVQLLAPFAALEKPAIHALAHEHGLDLGLTYSCEHANGPCGSCISCQEIATLAV